MGALLQILLRATTRQEESETEYEVDNNTVTCACCSTVAPPHETHENTAPEEREEDAPAVRLGRLPGAQHGHA